MSPSEDAHELVPPDVAASLPRLYETQDNPDPVFRLKLFTPDSSWTWLATEYDPLERLCFGLVIGHEREWGYFSISELETVRGPLGLKIERDLHFAPIPASEFAD